MKHVLSVLAVASLCGLLALSVHNDYYLRIGFMMCVYYLCGAGMNVLVGYAGQKSLGQAGLFAAGAYTVALLTSRTALDPWLALVCLAEAWRTARTVFRSGWSALGRRHQLFRLYAAQWQWRGNVCRSVWRFRFTAEGAAIRRHLAHRRARWRDVFRRIA